VTIFKNKYFLNNKNALLMVFREEVIDSFPQVYKVWKILKILFLGNSILSHPKKKSCCCFRIFLIFTIQIPSQRAQILGSTVKLDWTVERKYKPRIEETRKVRAAINSSETVFSKNVVICRYFLLFYVSKRAKKKIGDG
jgi:hypothetical protein